MPLIFFLLTPGSYIKESLQAENRIQALDGLAEGFLEYMKAIPKSTGNPPIVLCALMTEIFIALRDEAIFTGHLRPHFKHSFFEWLLKCFALFEPLRSEVDWRIGPLLANLASFPDLVLGLSKRLNSKKRDKEDCNGVKMLKIWLSRVRDDDVEPNQAHPSLARDNTLHQSHRIMSMISRPSKIWPEASELAECKYNILACCSLLNFLVFVPEFTRDRIRSLTRDFISLSPDTKISYINELRKYADADISGPITALLCKVLLTPFRECVICFQDGQNANTPI